MVKKRNPKTRATPSSPSLKVPPEQLELSELAMFLHEPHRLQIISQLYALEEADMIYLRQHLGLTWGNLSFHTSKMEEKGLVSIQKQFLGKKPYTLVKITEKGIAHFEEYKKEMARFLTAF